MGLESATYISDLNSSNPTGSDNISQGDDHLRLIKSTVKATFPNITGAVTATQAELNILDGATLSTTELNYVDGVTSAIQTQLDAKAPLASPALTGTPTAPTATPGTNNTQIATTEYVDSAVTVAAGGAYLPLSGGTMTGKIVGKASNATSAPLNLPHGTAPTSPVNGDIWSATDGIYARLNGSTVNLYNATSGGSGTVTSVGFSAPSIFSVANSPVTSSGTITMTLASQNQNLVFASPPSAAGLPYFRALAASDLPSAPSFAGGLTVTGGADITGDVELDGNLHVTGTLEVDGKSWFNDTVSITAGGLSVTGLTAIFGDFSAYAITATGAILPATDNAHDLGSALKQWQDIYLVNSPTVSSDVRFKQDIAPINSALPFIEALRPVLFKRPGDDARHSGFVAQEVAAAVPNGMSWAGWTEDESGKQALRYEQFIAYLTRAVQELAAEVKRLAAKAGE